MTRVLHLIKGLGPGGAEQLLVNHARSTPADDLDVTVAYLLPEKDHLVPKLEDAGWDTVCLRAGRPWDPRWVRRLRRVVVERDIDVVHGHSPLVSAFARLALKTLSPRRRPRLVYTEHNEWPRHRPWTRRLNRWTIGMEDHVIAVSAAVKAAMPDSLDVTVVIHGVDVQSVAGQAVHRDEVRAELGVGSDETVIGIVANFRREKAYDVLLQAASLALRQNPRLRFVSVGQGPLEAEIRALHDELGLGDRFLILGYRDDATRLMSAFDVFTLTSHHEGLPVSLMEAMALGLPVVATDVGGIAAAVENWPATIVPAGDVGGLAAGYLHGPTARSAPPRAPTAAWTDQVLAAYRG